ncbi:MAG: class I SAM-dependent methyltransferase [Ilumatobacteraceae bacterium]
MRAAVWRRLGLHFGPGDRVLELNCGTGADALWLAARGVDVLATDASQGMVDVARARGVRAVQCAAEDIAALAESRPPFDGVLSNFGGLNCVDDLSAVARSLAPAVRPGGVAVLCVMGPAVPWEWAWYLAHLQPGKAFRRFHDSTEWRGLTIRYPSARHLRVAFGPWFHTERTWALGALVPPSYAEPLAARFPSAVATLDRAERAVETSRLAVALADHYVVELRRR